VLGVASKEYSYETPHPLWSEQDPALWWRATVESVRHLLAKTGVDAAAVKGIGLTGQMHGLVLLDEKWRGAAPGDLVERRAHRPAV
jgi:xylulokinase